MSRVAGRSFLKKMYRVLAQSHCLALHMISNVSMSSGAANPHKSESPDSELVVAQFTVSGGGTTAICKHCLVRVERSSHAMLVKHLAACELLPEVMRHVLDEEAQEQAARHIGVYARHAELFSRFHVLGLLRAKCKTCETTVYGHLGSLHVHVALCKRSGKAVAARFARGVLPSCPSTAPRVNTPAQTPRPQQPRRCVRRRSVASTAAAVPTSPAASPRAARCERALGCYRGPGNTGAWAGWAERRGGREFSLWRASRAAQRGASFTIDSLPKSTCPQFPRALKFTPLAASPPSPLVSRRGRNFVQPGMSADPTLEFLTSELSSEDPSKCVECISRLQVVALSLGAENGQPAAAGALRLEELLPRNLQLLPLAATGTAIGPLRGTLTTLGRQLRR